MPEVDSKELVYWNEDYDDKGQSTPFSFGTRHSHFRDSGPLSSNSHWILRKRLEKTSASLLAIECSSVPEVFRSLWVQRVVHSNSAFSFVRVSGPGNKETVPFSISVCLRSTSAAQASSTSGSASRVAINRSTSLALSAAVNCKAAASSVSTVQILMPLFSPFRLDEQF